MTNEDGQRLPASAPRIAISFEQLDKFPCGAPATAPANSVAFRSYHVVMSRIRGVDMHFRYALITLALGLAILWVFPKLHEQWLRDIRFAELESEAELYTASHPFADDGGPRLPVRPDVTSGIDWGLLDHVPLFVTSIPKGYIGPRSVLEIKVLRFANQEECIDQAWNISVDGTGKEPPGPFALAEVSSVKRGDFDSRLVLLCGADAGEHFSVGARGLVYGTPFKNKDGRWRLQLRETYARMIVRRQSEGANCFLTFCFDPPEAFTLKRSAT